MDGQQHVELALRPQGFDKGQIARRIVPQARTAMELAYKAREPAEADWRRVAQLDAMAGQPEDGDGLARGGAVAFRQQDPQRLCTIGCAGHGLIIAAPGALVSGLMA